MPSRVLALPPQAAELGLHLATLVEKMEVEREELMAETDRVRTSNEDLSRKLVQADAANLKLLQRVEDLQRDNLRWEGCAGLAGGAFRARPTANLVLIVHRTARAPAGSAVRGHRCRLAAFAGRFLSRSRPLVAWVPSIHARVFDRCPLFRAQGHRGPARVRVRA